MGCLKGGKQVNASVVITLALLHTNNTNALWSHGSHHRWSSESTCSLWEPWFAAFWWTTSSGCVRQHTLAEQSVCAPLHRAIERDQHKAPQPFSIRFDTQRELILIGYRVVFTFSISKDSEPAAQRHRRCIITSTHARTQPQHKRRLKIIARKITHKYFSTSAWSFWRVPYDTNQWCHGDGCLRKWRLALQISMQALRTKKKKTWEKRKENARGINTLSWFEGRNITLWRGETC